VTSNLINFEAHGSRAPNVDNKAFLSEGHVYITSKANITQGVWPRYSKIK
jgi:hypothetical protein